MKIKKIAVLLTSVAIAISSFSPSYVYATDNVEIDETTTMEEQVIDAETVEPEAFSQMQEAPETPIEDTVQPAVAEPAPQDIQEDYQTQPDGVVEEATQNTPVQEEVKRVNASETEWKIDSKATVNQVKQIDMYVTSGTTKIEVFYSANMEKPEVIFKSASQNIYQAGTDVVNDSVKFKTVQNIVCTDIPEIHYDVIYISDAIDPGNWVMQISVVPNIGELLVVEASVDPNWETLNTEYKTAVKNVYCWYFKNDQYTTVGNSPFSVKDVERIFAAEEPPKTNQIAEAPEQEPEKIRIDWVTIGLIAAIIALIVVAILIFRKSKKANAEYEEEKHKSNMKTNKKLKNKHKKEENDELESMLDDFADEYLDDENEEKEDEEYYDEPDNIDEYEEKVNKKNKKKLNPATESVVQEPSQTNYQYQEPQIPAQPQVQPPQFQQMAQPQIQQPVYQQPQPVQQIPQQTQQMYYQPVMSEVQSSPQPTINLPVNASGKRPGWIIQNAAVKKPAWVDDINDIRNYFF